jgi:hypothetical protein
MVDRVALEHGAETLDLVHGSSSRLPDEYILR